MWQYCVEIKGFSTAYLVALPCLKHCTAEILAELMCTLLDA